MEYNQILIGKRLKELREQFRYTIEYLSEKIDISSSFLGHIERGEKEFSLKTLIKIYHVYNISTDYILFGDIDSFHNSIIKNICTELISLNTEDLSSLYDFIKNYKKNNY